MNKNKQRIIRACQILSSTVENEANCLISGLTHCEKATIIMIDRAYEKWQKDIAKIQKS